MIHYEEPLLFETKTINGASFDIYLNGNLIVKNSSTPHVDCAHYCNKNSISGLFRVRRMGGPHKYDYQCLVAVVAAKYLGSGIDSPLYGVPRVMPVRKSKKGDMS